MKKSAYIFLLAILTPLIMVSCSSSDKITEGKISYTITFPEFDAEEHTFLSVLLPKQQVYTFKHNDLHSSVKKAMVEINIITNSERKAFYSDLKFNENKYYEGTISPDDLHHFDIEFTDKTDTIAGFNVKQAFAKSNELGTIELWYTEEIEMSNPNWHTPYHEIPGLLIEYTLIQNGVTMHFKAAEFHDEVIDEAIFTPSRKGTQIEFEAFQNELSELFKNFLKP